MTSFEFKGAQADSSEWERTGFSTRLDTDSDRDTYIVTAMRAAVDDMEV